MRLQTFAARALYLKRLATYNPTMMVSCLYIVATPIGNRDDFSYRAIDVLKNVNIIAAEKPSHSKRLLDYYHIKTPLLSLHEHNEVQRLQTLMNCLERGEQVALISDAGTPLISDPGYRLVSAALSRGFRVVPVPGACAAIAALCASGLPTDRFVFEGFLPAKSSARQHYLQTLQDESRTIIFYESTHRIVESLEAMRLVFGNSRRATLARELTKTFETIRQDCLGNLSAWIQADPNQQKGEFVVLLHGAEKGGDVEVMAEGRRILSILMKEMPLKQAVTVATKILHGHRQAFYQLALSLKGIAG